MQHHQPSYNQQFNHGFSLIEILVVIVIIGLFAGSAVLMFDGNNSSSQLKRESQRLKQIIKIAMDESLINATQLGLVVTDEGYEFLLLKDRNWIPVSDDKALKIHRWPKNVEVFLQLEGLDADNKENLLGDFSLTDAFTAKLARDKEKQSLLEMKSDPNFAEQTSPEQQQEQNVSPQIYILSSGEITPFNLLLLITEQQKQIYFQIRSDVIGNIEVDGPYDEKPKPNQKQFNKRSSNTDNITTLKNNMLAFNAATHTNIRQRYLAKILQSTTKISLNHVV